MKRGLAAVVVSAAAALAVAAPTARAQVSNGPPVGTPLQMSPAPDKNGVIDKPPPYTVSGDFRVSRAG